MQWEVHIVHINALPIFSDLQSGTFNRFGVWMRIGDGVNYLTTAIVPITFAVITSIIAVAIITVTLTIIAANNWTCRTTDKGTFLNREDFQFDFFYQLGK